MGCAVPDTPANNPILGLGRLSQFITVYSQHGGLIMENPHVELAAPASVSVTVAASRRSDRRSSRPREYLTEREIEKLLAAAGDNQPSLARSRTRGQRTATGPMPVMISRSGRCSWRTSRWRPSSVSLSAWTLSKTATSASTAWANNARAPLRSTSVSGSAKAWLGELENVSLDHGVSLLRWRSGGVEHPHDTPPYSPHAATNFRP